MKLPVRRHSSARLRCNRGSGPPACATTTPRLPSVPATIAASPTSSAHLRRPQTAPAPAPPLTPHAPPYSAAGSVSPSLATVTAAAAAAAAAGEPAGSRRRMRRPPETSEFRSEDAAEGGRAAVTATLVLPQQACMSSVLRGKDAASARKGSLRFRAESIKLANHCKDMSLSFRLVERNVLEFAHLVWTDAKRHKNVTLRRGEALYTSSPELSAYLLETLACNITGLDPYYTVVAPQTPRPQPLEDSAGTAVEADGSEASAEADATLSGSQQQRALHSSGGDAARKDDDDEAVGDVEEREDSGTPDTPSSVSTLSDAASDLESWRPASAEYKREKGWLYNPHFFSAPTLTPLEYR